MSNHFPSPLSANEAEFGRLLGDLLRKQGWKVLEQPGDQQLRADLVAKRSGQNYVFEIKRASEGRRDRVIPPGFDLLGEDLQEYQVESASQKSGRLEKYSQTATQAILYFDSFAAGQTVTVRYRLRAKYPIRARTFSSRVYEYYNPAINSIARPTRLEIVKQWRQRGVKQVRWLAER
jgi:hypothetical protein